MRYLVLLILSLVCAVSTAYAEDSHLHVTASIAPVAYFAEKIGGEYVTVSTLVGSGQSPHTFEPTPHQIMDVSDAQLFVRIGEPFEDRLLEKIHSMRELTLVDLRSGITLHSDSHGHAHDPHIWLSPVLMSKQVALIADALCRIDSVHSAQYRRNQVVLTAELHTLDSMIAALLKPYQQRKVYVYHTAFGYFCEQYGLVQVAVEQEGKEPNGKWLTQIIASAKADGVTTIFTQPQYSARGAQTVADEIGARVVEIDPNAHDYAGNLLSIAQQIAASFSPIAKK
jgi:zinc transport system substrate-binding protein